MGRQGALQLTRFGNGIVAYAHKRYDEGEQARSCSQLYHSIV